jgi:hypothetical protein
MKVAPPLSVIGLFGIMALPLTAAAGGHCPGRDRGCAVEYGVSGSAVVVAQSTAQVVAAAGDFDMVPSIAPINTMPEGQTYGRWATQWFQWAIGIPLAENPLVDTSGAKCTQRQVDEVWFLAGSFGAGTFVRSCNVPAGKSLFFPLINNFYGAFLSDPPATRTEEYVRANGSCTEPAQISASIDNFAVPNPNRFFTGPSGSQSPIFNVQMPPGNVFGVDESVAPELVLSPSAEQGYYLFVRPLRPGKHTVHWTASGCTPGNVQDITYHLTVVDE